MPPQEEAPTSKVIFLASSSSSSMGEEARKTRERGGPSHPTGAPRDSGRRARRRTKMEGTRVVKKEEALLFDHSVGVLEAGTVLKTAAGRVFLNFVKVDGQVYAAGNCVMYDGRINIDVKPWLLMIEDIYYEKKKPDRIKLSVKWFYQPWELKVRSNGMNFSDDEIAQSREVFLSLDLTPEMDAEKIIGRAVIYMCSTFDDIAEKSRRIDLAASEYLLRYEYCPDGQSPFLHIISDKRSTRRRRNLNEYCSLKN
jgi:hypothetical protein